MKKLFTLLFAIGLITAASAQSGDRYRNDNRSNNNSYQSSPSSNYDQKGYSNQHRNDDQYDRNSKWNDRGDQNRYERDRRLAEQQRYEMMMRRKQDPRYDRRYDDHSSSGIVLPLLGLLAVIISQR